MAPILPFTTEEVWKYIPQEQGKKESVHLTSFPEVKSEYLDDLLYEHWERIWEIRAIVTKALEEARKVKKIGLSLDAQVQGYIVPSKLAGILAVGRPVMFLGNEQNSIAAAILRAHCGHVIPEGAVSRFDRSSAIG